MNAPADTETTTASPDEQVLAIPPDGETEGKKPPPPIPFDLFLEPDDDEAVGAVEEVTEPGAPMGRRKIVINLRELESLAGIGCTYDDAAFVLGCSTRTIHRRMNDTPGLRRCWEAGKSKGKVSLRRKAFSTVMGASSLTAAAKLQPLTIFLLKNLAGMSEAIALEHTVQIKLIREEDADRV